MNISKRDVLDLDYSLKITNDTIIEVIDNFLIVYSSAKDRYGIIDLNVKKVKSQKIEYKYKSITKVCDNRYIVSFDHHQSEVFGVIDSAGNEIINTKIYESIEYIDGYFHAKINDNYILINIDGKVIWSSADEIKKINIGFVITKKNKKFLIDEDGIIKSSSSYDDINSVLGFDNSVAIVQRNSKYGLIDKDGREVVPPIYDSIDYHKESEYFTFKRDNCVGIFDIKGQVIFKKRYKEIFYIGNHHYIVPKGLRYIILDETGKKLRKLNYDDCPNLTSNGIRYKGDGVFGHSIFSGVFETVFNSKGDILPLSDLMVYCIGEFCNERSIVKGIRGIGLIDNKGTYILKDKYQHIHALPNGLYEIGLNDLCGVVDRDGMPILPMKYDKINYLKGGFEIINHKLHGLTDDHGKILLEPVYPDIKQDGNYMIYGKDHQYGLINLSDKTSIDNIEKDIDKVYSNHYYIVLKHSDGSYSLFEQGNSIFKYKHIGSIYLLNDRQIIINNYLVNPNDIKFKSSIEFQIQNQKKNKIFETEQERDKYFDSLDQLKVQELEKRNKTQCELIEQSIDVNNDQQLNLFLNTIHQFKSDEDVKRLLKEIKKKKLD